MRLSQAGPPFVAGVALRVGCAAAVVAGVGLRLRPVLAADFPLNDGALFYVMIEAIRDHGYRLPATVAYNGTQIPFVYPPLGFYAAAALCDLLGTTPLVALRALPLVFDLALLGAFALLARALLPAVGGAWLAVAAFALLPGSYVWLIGGGGLTRALGLCFALLALRAALLLARRAHGLQLPSAASGRPVSPRGSTGRALVPGLQLGLFCGLTALTHPEMAWFLAVALAVLFLGFCRNQAVLRGLLAAVPAALLLVSSWLAAVLVAHGPSPLLAASETTSLLRVALQSVDEDGILVVSVLLIATLACMLLAASARLDLLLVGWLGLIFLLGTRSFFWLAAVPLALGLGYTTARLLSFRGTGTTAGTLTPPPALPHQGAGSGPASVGGSRSGSPAAAAAVSPSVWVSAACGLTFFALSWWTSARLSAADPGKLVPLSAEERTAMAWMAAHTPPESRFLVVSGDVWASDRSGEWLPLLATRVSLATPQGQEWITGGEFARRMSLHSEAQACATQDTNCLDQWAQRHPPAFTHLYLPKRAGGGCCDSLRASLTGDSRYERVYDGAAATVYARRG